jgi:ABC-2 type transporter
MTTVSTVMDSTVSDNTGNLALRVGPLEGLRQTFSLSWRTLVQIKHNPAELIDFSIQPVMFLLLFTFVFGGAIGGSPHAYLMFALPGIMVQNSLFTTLNTATGLSTDLEKGFFDRLRSLPIARFRPAVRPGPGRPGQADLGPRHAAGDRDHPGLPGRHRPARRAGRPLFQFPPRHSPRGAT